MHTNTLIVAIQMCSSAGALARSPPFPVFGVVVTDIDRCINMGWYGSCMPSHLGAI